MHTLEPAIVQYQDDERYFLLLGLCAIRCRTIGDAVTYLRRGLRIDDHNRDILQALAICAYIQNSKAQSIDYLLTALSAHPKYRPANALLQYIKSHSDSAPRQRAPATDHMRPFLPRIPYVSARVAYGTIASLAAAAAVACGVLLFVALPRAADDEATARRPGTEEIIGARGVGQYVDLQANSRYVFNNQQIAAILDGIERQFIAHADNEVCVDINRLLNSNAHEQIKQRMIFLGSYLSRPTFLSLSTEYSYSDVAAEPHLYNSCYIKWRGGGGQYRRPTGGNRVRFFSRL